MNIKQREELIKTAKMVISGEIKNGSLAGLIPSIGVKGLLNELIAAIAQQPFNLLQHMSDGGMVSSRNDTLYKFDNDEFLCKSRHDATFQVAGTHSEAGILHLLFENSLQPYQEPPAEFSVEWAVDQMVEHGHGACKHIDETVETEEANRIFR